MSDGVRVDIIYFNTSSDWMFETELHSRYYNLRMLTGSAFSRLEALKTLSRAVSRSETTIVVGGWNESVPMPAVVGKSVGVSSQRIGLPGRPESESVLLPQGAVPFAANGKIRAAVLRSGPQAIFFVDDDRKGRSELAAKFIVPYLLKQAGLTSAPAEARKSGKAVPAENLSAGSGVQPESEKAESKESASEKHTAANTELTEPAENAALFESSEENQTADVSGTDDKTEPKTGKTPSVSFADMVKAATGKDIHTIAEDSETASEIIPELNFSAEPPEAKEQEIENIVMEHVSFAREASANSETVLPSLKFNNELSLRLKVKEKIHDALPETSDADIPEKTEKPSDTDAKDDLHETDDKAETDELPEINLPEEIIPETALSENIIPLDDLQKNNNDFLPNEYSEDEEGITLPKMNVTIAVILVVVLMLILAAALYIGYRYFVVGEASAMLSGFAESCDYFYL